MSGLEIGLEVQKVVDQILKELVITNSFEKILIKTIDDPIVAETVEAIFQKFLEQSSKEEKKGVASF